MYCLPYPEDTDIPPIEVPLTDIFVYDPLIAENFENFPRRCGFADYDRPLSELACLMQYWLFFGFIAEFLGQRIDVIDFTKRPQYGDGSQSVIDIRLDRCLSNRWDQRLKGIRNLDKPRAEAIQESIMRKIDITKKQCQEFERVQAPVDSLSVQLLLSWLHKKFDRLEKYKSCPLLPQYSDVIPLSTQLLMARMTNRGWCPQRVKVVCSLFNYFAVYYISSLRRQAPLHINHQHCTENAWIVSNFQNDDQMACFHRVAGCSCAEIGPPMKDVNEIIKAGGVPLISVKRKGLGDIELDVINCASYIRYVAISHVCSDCQFGVKRNSLPNCQLQHLDELITNLPKDFGRGMWLFDKLHSFCSNIARYLRLTKSQYPTSGQRLFWLDTVEMACHPCICSYCI